MGTGGNSNYATSLIRLCVAMDTKCREAKEAEEKEKPPYVYIYVSVLVHMQACTLLSESWRKRKGGHSEEA